MELRIPGMWYECNSCGSKIDSPAANLYCRSHEHDFDINQAEMLAVSYFKLKENASMATVAAVRVHIHILSITSMIKKVLASKNFAVEEAAQVKGRRSRLAHTMSFYAYNRENRTVLVEDIKVAANAEVVAVVEDADIIYSFIKVMNISPSITPASQ
jgi:hypothetical protein